MTRLLVFCLVCSAVLSAGVWYCSQCGHSNPDYEKQCNYCGKPK
ncbi:MAG: zinc-ribbon domain-containing protein [Chlamydiia bacterium]|nr:zinc-ribbon domain-containing protein [Chlamydiia bacterium]